MTAPLRTRRRVGWGAVVVTAAWVAAASLNCDFSAVSTPTARLQAWGRVRAFVRGFASPDLSASMLETTVNLALETIAIAVLSTVLGAAVGLCLAMVASGRASRPRSSLARRAAREGVRLVLDGLRGVPDFAWALLLLVGPGPGPVTGILALALTASGILGKIYAEQWDSTAAPMPAPLVGRSGLIRVAYWLVPANARRMLSYTLLRFECNMRNAAVVGVVGGGGLGGALLDEFTFGRDDRVAVLLGTLLVLTASADFFSNRLRSGLRANIGASAAIARRRWVAGLSVAALCGTALAVVSSGLGVAYRSALRVDGRWLAEQGRALGDISVAHLLDILPGAGVVLSLAIVGSVLAFAGAVGAVWLAAVWPAAPHRMIYGRSRSTIHRALDFGVAILVRGLALVLRAVPDVAWLLIFAAALRTGVLPAVLAIVLHSTGVLARLFIEAVQDVEPARIPRVAWTRTTLLAYAVLPRVGTSWRSYWFYQFEANVRAGLVLGIVGVGGLGDRFHTAITFWDVPSAAVCLVTMVALTSIVDRLGRLSGIGPTPA